MSQKKIVRNQCNLEVFTEETKPKNDKSLKRLSLTILIFNFLQELSIIGLKKVLNSEGLLIRRVSWFILIIFSLGFMFFQVEDRISYYLSYDTNSKLHFTPLSKIKFPTVTICNENRMIKNKISRYINGL